MRETTYISATTLAKKAAMTLDALDRGETEKMIILKNNAPKAVLLSMEAYEAMEEEIEDLRLASLAMIRQESFQREKAVSHAAMMEKFAK